MQEDFFIRILEISVMNSDDYPRLDKKSIKVNDLITTQSSIRDLVHVYRMAEFVASGGIYSISKIESFKAQQPQSSNKLHHSFRKPQLIQIAFYPDGKMYIWDGHHRVASICLGGRDVIYPEEYEFIYLTYKLTMEVNFDDDYVTPFDPRTEVRIPDFSAFKRKVDKIRKRFSDEAAMEYICENRQLYAEARTSDNIDDWIFTSLKLERPQL
eukprot:TRINITY_DN640_c0_g1_i9.p1 TRINITY_DN640_c0_g1~~TRINITY_DN640_c0_g1_i9.p1  ORF type:complete len:212 (-),score=29.60 TRINITY_DN640_c0_g1_i9:50-685(-)